MVIVAQQRRSSPPATLAMPSRSPTLITDLAAPAATEPAEDTAAVYGDAAYGAGEVLDRLDAAGIDIKTKVQPPTRPPGSSPRTASTSTSNSSRSPAPTGPPCRSARSTATSATPARPTSAAPAPLARSVGKFTESKTGRSITVGHHEAHLAAARTRQTDSGPWGSDDPRDALSPKSVGAIRHNPRRWPS
jgi:hypothetical protein